MALSKFKIKKGTNLDPQAAGSNSATGDMEVLSSDGKMHYHNGTSDSPMVTEAHASTLTNKTIDADSNTITNIENADIKAAAAIDVNKLAAVTASRAVVSDGSGFISAATTTATEIGYVNGVTSAIQTQINGKQATGNYVTDLTGDVTASGPGSAAATIQTNVVSNTKLAQMPTLSIKGNNTGGTANAIDLTVSQVNSMLGTLSNPMTTAGDIIYGGSSGTPARLAKGIKGQHLVVDAGGTNTPGYQWNSSNIVSNADYTVTDTDGYNKILVTTGSTGRIVTLPDATTNSGREIEIFKADSGTGTVAIQMTGGQTLNGATSRELYGIYSRIKALSNGTNWIILDEAHPTWLSFTSPTSQGFGTLTNIVYYWKKDDASPNILIRGGFTSGTVTGSEARLQLPASLTSSSSIRSGAEAAGTCETGDAATTFFKVSLLVQPSVTYVLFGVQSSTLASGNVAIGSNILSNSRPITFQGRIPISGV